MSRAYRVEIIQQCAHVTSQHLFSGRDKLTTALAIADNCGAHIIQQDLRAERSHTGMSQSKKVRVAAVQGALNAGRCPAAALETQGDVLELTDSEDGMELTDSDGVIELTDTESDTDDFRVRVSPVRLLSSVQLSQPLI